MTEQTGGGAAPGALPTSDFARIAVEGSTDLLLVLDDAFVIQWASPSLPADLGWQPHEVVGRTTEPLVHPDDRGFRAAALAQAREHGRGSARARIRARDGSYTWMDGRLRALPEGGYVLSLRDASAEMLARAEADVALAELSAKESVLRATLDSMLDAHLVLQPILDGDGELVDLRYLEVNPSATDYIGLPSTTLVGRTVSEFFGGAGVETVLGWCREALTTQRPVILDDVTMTSSLDGLPRRLDLRAVPVDGRVHLTWRDQTERHRQEDEARDELARTHVELYDWITRYRLIADHERDVVVRLRQGMVEWVSPSLGTTFGLPAGSWDGRRFTELVDGLITPGPTRPRWEVEHDSVGPVRARLVDGDGLPRLVEVVAARYPRGSTIVTITDITRTAVLAGRAGTWLVELEGAEPLSLPDPPTALGDLLVAVLHLEGLVSVDHELGPQAREETWRTLRRRLMDAGVPAHALRRRDSELVAVLPATYDDPTGAERARAWVDAVAEPVHTNTGITRCLLYVGLATAEPDESITRCTQRAITAVLSGVAAREPITLAPGTP